MDSIRADDAASPADGIWNKHSRCTEYHHLWEKNKKKIFHNYYFHTSQNKQNGIHMSRHLGFIEVPEVLQKSSRKCTNP